MLKISNNHLPANANCLMKKSIRDFLRFPSRSPARTAVLPATITANNSHSTANCSVYKEENVCLILMKISTQNFNIIGSILILKKF